VCGRWGWQETRPLDPLLPGSLPGRQHALVDTGAQLDQEPSEYLAFPPTRVLRVEDFHRVVFQMLLAMG